jgi:hypothetical protein
MFAGNLDKVTAERFRLKVRVWTYFGRQYTCVARPVRSFPGRIYIVEPTGPFMDDPNLTDKKFPGNPTKSYRAKEPVRVLGEVKEWQGHSPEQLKTMKDHLQRLKQLGIEHVDD